MKKKKSDLSNCLQEPGDSGSGLKIVEDFYKSRKPREYKNEAPTLRSDRQGLLVSGQTKSTNTHVKSTEKGLVICHNLQPRRADRPSLLKNPGAGGSGHLTKPDEAYCLESANQQAVENGTNQAGFSKAISGKSPSQIYPTMTFSQVASLVKVFPLREGVKVFKTSQGELFSSKSAESLEVKDRATYSLRTLKDYFLTTQVEPSQLYSFHWMNLGTMSSGRCVTLNISFHKTGKGSLSSVLEDEVDEKYYLSDKVLNKLNEQTSRISPKEYSYAIPTPAGGHHIPKIAQALQTDGQLRQGCSWGTNVPQSGRNIRRLTPIETERLQGFPDNWTKVPTKNNNAGMAWDCHPESKETIIKGKVMSDTQRYKMMGNAVSVPVITAIGKRILKSIK